MKPETVQKLMGALDGMYQRFGCANYEEGMDMIRSTANQLEEFLENAGTREKMEAMIVNAPEPSALELLEILGFMKGMPFLLKSLVPTALKELPSDPGGRPVSLTAEESQNACLQIGELMAKGATLAGAQLRVAQRKDVSLRTIQRCWQKRGGLDL